MVTQGHLDALILRHLTELAGRIGARPTGSRANQQAGDYIREVLAGYGWTIEQQPFDCLDWRPGAVALTCGGKSFSIQSNPYSPAFDGQYPLAVCRDESELAGSGSLRGRMVVLAGALAQDAYMPKHFPFLTLEDQQRVIQRLEAAQPEAVIGLHASPLFCDADFRLPSVTLSPTEGAALLDRAGEVAALRIISHTSPSTGGNIVARGISHSAKRIVICAHFDTWFNTPGALDNAAGVAALLVLAGLLDPRRAGVELVAFNGEDNYAAPGQVVYLRSGVAEIAYVINIDGIGAVGKPNSLARFGEAPTLWDTVQAVKQNFPGLVEVEPWPQGDHMIFVQQGIPAVALSSADAFDLWLNVTHTPADTVEQVNASQIAEAARFVHALVRATTPA